jgi:hypothetical protein
MNPARNQDIQYGNYPPNYWNSDPSDLSDTENVSKNEKLNTWTNKKVDHHLIDCKDLIKCLKTIHFDTKEITKICNAFYKKMKNKKNEEDNVQTYISEFNTKLVYYLIENHKKITLGIRLNENILFEFQNFILCIIRILFGKSSNIEVEFLKSQNRIPYDLLGEIQNHELQSDFSFQLRNLNMEFFLFVLYFYLNSDIDLSNLNHIDKKFYYIIFEKILLSYLLNGLIDVFTFDKLSFSLVEKIYPREYHVILRLYNKNKDFIANLPQFYGNDPNTELAKTQLLNFYKYYMYKVLFDSYFKDLNILEFLKNDFSELYRGNEKLDLVMFFYKLVMIQHKDYTNVKGLLDRLMEMLLVYYHYSETQVSEIKKKIFRAYERNIYTLRIYIPEIISVYQMHYFNNIFNLLVQNRIQEILQGRITFIFPHNSDIYLYVMDFLYEFVDDPEHIVDYFKLVIEKYQQIYNIDDLVKSIETLIGEPNGRYRDRMYYFAYRGLVKSIIEKRYKHSIYENKKILPQEELNDLYQKVKTYVFNKLIELLNQSFDIDVFETFLHVYFEQFEELTKERKEKIKFNIVEILRNNINVMKSSLDESQMQKYVTYYMKKILDTIASGRIPEIPDSDSPKSDMTFDLRTEYISPRFATVKILDWLHQNLNEIKNENNREIQSLDPYGLTYARIFEKYTHPDPYKDELKRKVLDFIHQYYKHVIDQVYVSKNPMAEIYYWAYRKMLVELYQKNHLLNEQEKQEIFDIVKNYIIEKTLLIYYSSIREYFTSADKNLINVVMKYYLGKIKELSELQREEIIHEIHLVLEQNYEKINAVNIENNNRFMKKAKLLKQYQKLYYHEIIKLLQQGKIPNASQMILTEENMPIQLEKLFESSRNVLSNVEQYIKVLRQIKKKKVN